MSVYVHKVCRACRYYPHSRDAARRAQSTNPLKEYIPPAVREQWVIHYNDNWPPGADKVPEAIDIHLNIATVKRAMVYAKVHNNYLAGFNKLR